jgi:hypothetical protein
VLFCCGQPPFSSAEWVSRIFGFMEPTRSLLDDIREVADLARKAINSPTLDTPVAERLIEKLEECSHESARQGFVYSEYELDRLAYLLERRMGRMGEL